MKSVSAP